jgi:arginyl-tRNA synthetase
MGEDLQKQAEEVLQQAEALRAVVAKLEERVQTKPAGSKKKEAAEKALEIFKPKLNKLMDTFHELSEKANISELDDMIVDGDTEALSDFLENLTDDYLGGPDDDEDPK